MMSILVDNLSSCLEYAGRSTSLSYTPLKRVPHVSCCEALAAATA